MDEFVDDLDPLPELSKQKPDRIIGLGETKNIRELLERPARFMPCDTVAKLRDKVRCRPLKNKSIPLLFPFLVLEAKSDSAHASPSDIQTQTAFPIRSLLNHQKELQSFRPGGNAGEEPLVWFLGNRGSNWILYACYIDQDFESNPNYNIHYLQSVDITTNDGAIQLLLLVDYIVDWARDTFRTSIITQLRSLATGVDFDQVSLGPDSDIVSKNGFVLDWMSRIDSDSRHGEVLHASGVGHMGRKDHDERPSVTLRLCELGAVRSASTNIFKFAGLRVTEGNIESLLTLSNNPADKCKDPLDHSGNFRASARRLFNEIMRWKEVLLVLGADLDHVEHAWTDARAEPVPFDEGAGAEFYALFEYRCFINIRWQIVRQFSYLAISKKAYALLMEYAAFIKRHPRTDQWAQAPRACSSSSIKEAIECLRSGSAWQVLHSAISSTLLTLYPLPARVREYDTPPVVSLGLGYRNAVRIRHFIEDFMSLAERSIPEWSRVAKKLEPSSKRHKGQNDAWEAKTANRSFRKVSQREVQVLDDPHIPLYCPRCRASRQKMFPPQSLGQENSPLYTSYKAILVSSLREEGEYEYEGQKRHDISLFVFEALLWQENATSIATAVKCLAQHETYHTILHLPTEKSLKLGSSRCKDWNLPMPYRGTTKKQQWDIARWISELINGQVPPDGDITQKSLPPWIHQQMLLYFLQQNKPYDEALKALRAARDRQTNKDQASVPSNRISLRHFFGEHIKDRNPDEERRFNEERRLSGE
ncbi:anthranilate synthase / indole-3-glycerol phosphate synthase [Vermiconidia calcicola]|uniref:Anthranilate synthase / indole-3-glycerol phosphate synthase n=1 Tax=Vermiconidia calcicola TaxID=1690605 RepID=A0ACC3MVI9_9PEZI|nr:anthranilate synthase / indole-3-glycerol phosphate synthase [Vermiconidia calcicola]